MNGSKPPRRRRGPRGRSTKVDRVRLAAIEILDRWLQRGDHVEDVLEHHEQHHLARVKPEWTYAERRRLREIVFGCVRLRGRYDHAISLRQDARKSAPPRLRALLWTALHEISEMKSPDHAVVDQAVSATRELDLAWASSFVNAILRRVLREGVLQGMPTAESDPIGHAVHWWSHPQWLVSRWHDLLGASEMLELCEANNERPRVVLRSAPGGRGKLRRAMAEFEWEGQPIEFAPDALELCTRVPVSLVLDQVGVPCTVQDAAAQLVAPLVSGAVKSRSRVLDLCAAPGGKATHLAQLLGKSGEVIACDLSPSRLNALLATRARLGLEDQLSAVAADGRVSAFRPGSFDAVLLDAPCTGTGVLARRHDARWLRKPEDLVQLPRLQTALLEAALDLLRPGGIVVYATCSLEGEENDEVVDSVLERREDVEEVGVGDDLPETLRRAGRLQTWPHRHGLDGAFAARLRKRN